MHIPSKVMGREFFEQPATCSHSSIMVRVDRVMGFEPQTSAIRRFVLYGVAAFMILFIHVRPCEPTLFLREKFITHDADTM